MAATPNSIIVFSVAGSAIVIIGGAAAKGNAPAPRAVFGAGVAFVGLGLLSDVAPELAAPLALLTFATVVVTKGPDAIKAIDRIVKRGPAPIAEPGSPATTGPAPILTGPVSTVVGAAGCSSLHGVKISGKYASEAASIEQRFGVKLTSGYRSPMVQAVVDPGVQSSDHLCGYAGDFSGAKRRMDALFQWAIQQGFAVVVYRGRYYLPGGGGGPWSDHYDHVHISFERCSGKVGCQ